MREECRLSGHDLITTEEEFNAWIATNPSGCTCEICNMTRQAISRLKDGLQIYYDKNRDNLDPLLRSVADDLFPREDGNA